MRTVDGAVLELVVGEGVTINVVVSTLGVESSARESPFREDELVDVILDVVMSTVTAVACFSLYARVCMSAAVST